MEGAPRNLSVSEVWMYCWYSLTLLVLWRAFFSTPRRKSSYEPTSSLGLYRSRRRSGVFSVDESLGNVSVKGVEDPGGERVLGLLMGGLLGPGPAALCGTAWMLTLRAVAIVGPMPSPFPLWPRKLSGTSPSSCMMLGALCRSTAVASLWSLEKPGREIGGLVGGGMWVNL